MIYSEHYNFCFFELPRTGTTSVREALATAGIAVRVPGDRHLSISQFIRENGGIPDGCKVASCVRNPMDRVLSLYVKLSHNQNEEYSKLRDRPNKNLASRRLLKHYELIKKNQWQFEEYFLAMYKWPYTDWMYHDARYCDYILRFENLNEDYHEFMHGVGVSVVPALPKLNETHNKEDLWESCGYKALKRAAWVFGPYLERFGYEYSGVTGKRIGALQRTCFLAVECLYMMLKRINRTQGYSYVQGASYSVGR